MLKELMEQETGLLILKNKISTELMWSIVIDQLPKLKEEIDILIEE